VEKGNVLNLTFKYFCGEDNFMCLTLIMFGGIFLSCGNELSYIRMQETPCSGLMWVSHFAGVFGPSTQMLGYFLDEAMAASFQIPCNSSSINNPIIRR
jgi:hypothetical protein